MMPSESVRLSEFSLAVRESTLKRLGAVPGGRESWRPTKEAMSSVDLVRHLIESDLWLFEKLKTTGLVSIRGKSNTENIKNRQEYLRLIDELNRVGQMRAMLIRNLSENDLSGKVFDDRVPGEIEVWWLIVRGNLDHEIHHRGQVAAYLRFLSADS